MMKEMMMMLLMMMMRNVATGETKTTGTAVTTSYYPGKQDSSCHLLTLAVWENWGLDESSIRTHMRVPKAWKSDTPAGHLGLRD